MARNAQIFNPSGPAAATRPQGSPVTTPPAPKPDSPVQPRSLAEVDAIHPPCKICGQPVERRDNERRDKWRMRLTCSAKCRARLQGLSGAGRSNPRATAPHPPCIVCNGPIVRRDGEPQWNYSVRRTCSAVCANELNPRSNLVAAQARAGWPPITGSTLRGTPFAPHNIAPRDGGAVKVDRPATIVLRASSIEGGS